MSLHVLVMPSWYRTPTQPQRGIFFREQAMALRSVGCRVGLLYVFLRSLRPLGQGILAGPGSERWLDDKGLPTLERDVLGLLPRIPGGNDLLLEHATAAALSRYVKRHGRPDILHAHSLVTAGPLARSVSKLLGVPYVVTEHNSRFLDSHAQLSGERRMGRAWADASARIAVSPALQLALQDRYPSAPATLWLPNLVDHSFVRGNPPSGTSFTFACVAGLIARKGHALLIEAFARALRGLPCKLLIVGAGPAREGLERQVAGLDLEGQVQFLGNLERREVLATLQSSHAFVLASERETFSVATLEALACGKPVVVTRCGGPESFVRPEDGYLVDVGDVQGMADALSRMVENWHAFDPEALAGRVLREFGGEAIAGRLVDLYRTILSR